MRVSGCRDRMQLTRCTQWFLALVTLLTFFSFVFDDIPSLIAAAGLALFLTYRAVFFLSGVNNAASAVQVTRNPGKRFVRQGTVVKAETLVTCINVPGLSLTFADNLPAGTFLVSGKSVMPFLDNDHKCRLRYGFRSLAVGTIIFTGITMSAKDRFFRSEMVINKQQKGDQVVVYPSVRFNQEYHAATEGVGIEKITPIKSMDIRAFREYADGDTLRDIDWKLSAKYNKLYVKEYMGLEENDFLYVVDLPDASLPYPEPAFEKLKEGIGSLLAKEFTSRTKFTVFFISGGNFIGDITFYNDPDEITDVLNMIQPENRTFHLYRTGRKDRVSNALRGRENGGTGAVTENDGMEYGRFTEHLKVISDSFAENNRHLFFERQLRRVLHGVQSSSLTVFSLAVGDVSHLRSFAKVTGTMKMKSFIYIPEGAYDTETDKKLSGCLFDRVEVIP